MAYCLRTGSGTTSPLPCWRWHTKGRAGCINTPIPNSMMHRCPLKFCHICQIAYGESVRVFDGRTPGTPAGHQPHIALLECPRHALFSKPGTCLCRRPPQLLLTCGPQCRGSCGCWCCARQACNQPGTCHSPFVCRCFEPQFRFAAVQMGGTTGSFVAEYDGRVNIRLDMCCSMSVISMHVLFCS